MQGAAASVEVPESTQKAHLRRQLADVWETEVRVRAGQVTVRLGQLTSDQDEMTGRHG